MSTKHSLLRIYQKSIHTLPKPVRARFFHGGTKFCPLCNSDLRIFVSAGTPGSPIRPNALCPVCFSLERHRFDWLFMREQTNLLDNIPKRILHIAPEKTMEKVLRQVPSGDYLSGDLLDPAAMERIDITDIHYPDDHFDVIYCSHVLEHVPDDGKAMREFRRVLNPLGWALLQVPITADRIDEDPTIDDPREQQRRFGQKDHVRRYGLDYIERLQENGFCVTHYRATDLHTGAERIRFGIRDDEHVFYCVK